MIMSFYRRTPVRCERLQGVKNPRQIEPQSSICRETLTCTGVRRKCRYAQSDMLESISSNLDTPCKRLCGLIERARKRVRTSLDVKNGKAIFQAQKSYPLCFFDRVSIFSNTKQILCRHINCRSGIHWNCNLPIEGIILQSPLASNQAIHRV